MARYLVEEHWQDPGSDGEAISFHITIEAKDEKAAFREAARRFHQNPVRFGKRTPYPYFYFTADELVTVSEGYLWQAYDGSSVGYDVRKIDEVMRRVA